MSIMQLSRKNSTNVVANFGSARAPAMADLESARASTGGPAKHGCFGS